MKRSIVMNVIILLSLVLSSCSLAQFPAPQPTVDQNAFARQVAQQLETQIVQLTASAPTSTPTPTPQATATPSITPTPGNEGVAKLFAPAPFVCNSASFVTDVTIPDNTLIPPGVSFVKTWRLENNGTCSWNPDYRIVFDQGDRLSAPAAFNMPGTITPGQTVDLSVGMVSPVYPGTYQGYWKILDQNGNAFGVGVNAASDFYVLIAVGYPSP